MSGYFDALMRSGGMPIGGPAPAPAHVEPSLPEIDVESTPAAMPLRSAEMASTPQQDFSPTRVANPVEALATPAPLAADTDTHDGQTGIAGVEPAHVPAAADAAADSPAPPAPRPAETSTPALGQALVRAAMQWVAADAHRVRDAAQVVPPRGRSVPAPGVEASEEISVVTTTGALRERGEDMQAQPPRAMTAIPAAPDPAAPEPVAAREPVAAPALPIRSTRPTQGAPHVPVAPVTRDEVVEISIGAIHVRVDAPSAQTVARPAPPAAAPRAATARAPRSALSRRALRRI